MILLPVWHKITREEVAEYSPILAGRMAKMTEEGIQCIVNGVIELGMKDQEGLNAIITAQRDPGEIGMGQQGRFGIRLSDNAMKVAQLFNTRSENAFHHDPSFNLNEVMEELSISREEAEEAFDELDEGSFLKIQKVSNNQNAWPNIDLFIYTDPIFQGHNPIEDAKTVSRMIMDHFPTNRTIAIKDIDEILEWGPRRINPAITYLVDHEIVKGSSTFHSGPYIYLWLMTSPRTRRYAKDE